MSFDIFEMWDAMKETKYRQTLEQLEKKLDNAEGVLDKAIAESLTLACDAVHAEAGSFWFYDLYGDKLIHPKAVHGDANIWNILLKPGEGIAGSVIKCGDAMIVKDCTAEPKWNSCADLQSGFTTKSMICVPILFDKRAIGCIQLLNRTDGSMFDEKDLAFEKQFSKVISKQFDERGLFAACHLDESTVVLVNGLCEYAELSRKLPPQKMAQMLNDYYSFISGYIEKYHGTLGENFGGCTMAYWCTESHGNDATIRAFRAALEIMTDADNFSASLKEKYGYDFYFGAGIHKGLPCNGMSNSAAFTEYEDVSDTVDIAFALQKAAKKNEILISQSVLEALPNQAKVKRVFGITKDAKIHEKIFRLVNM